MTIYSNYKFTNKECQWRGKASSKIRRKLIKNQTKAEKILYYALLKFLKGKCAIVCQKVIYTPKSFYLADFFLRRYRLIIEIDGDYHNTKEQQQLDHEREKHFLIRKDFKIIRFTNNEILYDLPRVINIIVSEGSLRESIALTPKKNTIGW